MKSIKNKKNHIALVLLLMFGCEGICFAYDKEEEQFIWTHYGDKLLSLTNCPTVFSNLVTKTSYNDFYKNFEGVDSWSTVCREGKSGKRGIETESVKVLSLLLFSVFGKEVRVNLHWHRDEESARKSMLLASVKNCSQILRISEYYQPMSLGTFALVPKDNECQRLYFYRNNVSGNFYFKTPCSREKVIKLLQEIDNLLCGKSDFLPEDTPEFVEIRKAYEAELLRRRKVAAEESAKREREWKEQQRKKKIENLNTFAVKPEQERDAYKKLETRFELLKNHLKPKSVPAGMHDPDAWKKLSQKTIPPLFKKYKFYMNEWQEPLLFGFNVWRDDPEIKKTKPKGTDYDVEIAHAKTFEDAWDWALYFRLKYSEDTEQRARLTMKQLARATHRDAFPNLGDLNISWRGRMTSSFYPEEKSAESLIIFIRGTTTVCVRSCYTDSSALPLARLLDKQLLEGDASRSVEFYLPENF